MKITSDKKGFTLIELIMAIIILGVVMVPLGMISIEHMRGVVYSRKLSIAEGLAKTEMAKINNLSYTDSTLEDGDDDTTSNYEGYAYDLRRTVSFVAGWSNNLKQVQVRVYPTGTTEQLVNLLTYIANVSFGSGSGGAAAGGGDQADSFSISGGTIDKKKLKNITTENTGGSQIVVTKVKVTFTGKSGIYLKKIKMDNSEVWSGIANSGDEVTLDTTFTMDAATSYTKHQFEFEKDIYTVTVDYYEFEDATQTGSYSWP